MKTIVIILSLISFSISSIAIKQNHSAEKQSSYKRWAIIAGPSVKKTGIGDLVLINIQRIKGVELVEREQINKLLKELAFSAIYLQRLTE